MSHEECGRDCSDCPHVMRQLYANLLRDNPEAFRKRRLGVVNLKAEETITRASLPHPYLYVMYSGWAYTGVVLRDGRRQIIDYFLPGDMLMSPGSLPIPAVADWSYKTLTDASICVLDAELVFSDIKNDQGLFIQYCGLLAERLGRLVNLLTDIGCRRATGRIAQFLIYLEGRLRRIGLSHNGAFDFPISQDHLASTLGMTNVHVSRTIRELRERRVIDFSKGSMTILNADVLHKIAEDH
jgi:CRP-like cAMP-binding protein